jgi:pimeloyl-ACP methyl ester carboxylesterase/DNA-binding CsgD family transcriptional regulator
VRPETKYAHSGPFNIAYQAWGTGPLDLVLIPGFISHVEYAWQEPSLAGFLRRLSSLARVISFDKRGMGLSDRDPRRETPTMDERIDDVLAVLRATESDRVCVMSWSEGGPLALLLAERFPDLVDSLIMVGTSPRFTAAPDFREGIPMAVLELFVEALEEEWGTGVGLELYAPSLAEDHRLRSWWAAYQRFAATPGAVAASLRMHLTVDARDALASIACPTLIIHQRGDMLVPVTCARYAAGHIPNARYVELPGSDHMYWLGNQGQTLGAIAVFLAGTPSGDRHQAVGKRGRPATGWESLTESESLIVDLVAAGLTNREIGSRLYISPRTVQVHLAHTFTKLGISRRSELAALASQRLR